MDWWNDIDYMKQMWEKWKEPGEEDYGEEEQNQQTTKEVGRVDIAEWASQQAARYGYTL